MRNYITSSDVKRRMSILKEQADCSQITSTRTCYNLYEVANRTKNVSDIIAFYKECNQGSYNADAYLDKCITLMESANDSRVTSAFQDFVLPIVSRSVLGEAYTSIFTEYADNTRKLLKTQYDYDLAMEQVNEFHEAIKNNGTNLIEFASNELTPDDMVIMKCCSCVEEVAGNLPLSVKAIASVNEALYVLEETGRDHNSFCVVMEVYDYFGFSFNNQDFNNFISGLQRDPMCAGYYTEGFAVPDQVHDLKADIQKEFDKSSKIGLACKKFNSSTKKEEDFIELKNSVFKSSTDDIQNNFNLFLNTLFRASATGTVDVSKYICDNIIPEIGEFISTKSSEDMDDVREFVLKISSHVREAIDKCSQYINDQNNLHVTENIIYLKNALTKLEDSLEASFDYIYPTYAAECAFKDFVFEKDNNVKTTKDFKLFKFDNIVTRCYKIDKFLINKFNSFKDKFKKNINSIGQKIFEESTIYEMLTDEGNLDYCVTSFDILGIESFKEYHDFCTSCIRYINTEILAESGMVCYYQVNPDTLEFRIKENLNLELSDEDRTLIEQSLPIEDINRVDRLLEAAESYSDYNFIEESKRFFRKYPDTEWFGTYLEAAAMAGVPKDIIVEVYETVRDYSGPSFVVGASYPVSQYKPLNCDIDTVMEAVTSLELILEADKPLTDRQKAIRAKKEAQLAKWEKEEEEAENKKNGIKKTSEPKKVEKVPEKKEQPKKEKKPIKTNNPKVDNALNKASQIADKAGEKAGEGIDKLKRAMTSMKLYVHALRGKMKDLDGKAQTAVRNMDDTVARLAKGIKQALVSDRREAIIKGSVIPSFHKCILIAVAEAGLWMINPPIAIIAAVGGFAASKQLTKKERALLYDDIIIEIKILDKEIQRAEDKNQVKKLRQLMRMRKELERQAGRIKYNIRVGKDLVPGGRYINQDKDLE